MMTYGRCLRALSIVLVPLLLAAPLAAQDGAWRDPSPHRAGRVQVNGVGLHYLDWGGSGPALIFLAGIGSTAHIYDDLAPRFTDRFRVLSLTRRGTGESDRPATGYDTQTLTQDLLAFMDSLGIRRATLAGWSLGGSEITRAAIVAPERVAGLIYFDAAYDYAGFGRTVARQDPVRTPPPTEAELASFDAFRARYERVEGVWSPAVEADVRVTYVQPDGSIRPDPMDVDLEGAALGELGRSDPDWSRLRVPVLAFYSVARINPDLLPVTDPEMRRLGQAYWTDVYLPWQRAKIQELRAGAPHARIVEIDAPHLIFVRPRDLEVVIPEMDRFLAGC
jgi:pimeloyl-ACP methyl ester carboxylesterase